ncbi:MAG: hypothetical protein R3B95_10660 [Nitrospirales bacterium]|nr:hypothetical protein [Nitrospira sp.]MDR4483662.1 hypothetical protein [Nitrospirales bacterium]
MDTKTISQVLQEYRTWILKLPDVTGLAQGGTSQNPHITIYLRSHNEKALQQIPRTLEGFTVTIIETGPIQACDPP